MNAYCLFRPLLRKQPFITAHFKSSLQSLHVTTSPAQIKYTERSLASDKML